MEGRVIGITGGASGIGLATAKLLASRGAKISIADISGAQLKAAKDEIKQAAPNTDEVLTCECDVRELSQVEDWIKQTVEKFGKLDGAYVDGSGIFQIPYSSHLGNLAGTVGSNPAQKTMDEQDEDQWNFIIGVNLTGVMHSIKVEVKNMTKGGSIVNASSIAGIRGYPKLGAYCASKHGVAGLTKTAAMEFGPRGIRVNAIAPGYINTPMTTKLTDSVGTAGRDASIKSTPLGRAAEPIEVAALIAFLLSDDASYVTGAIYEVDAGRTS